MKLSVIGTTITLISAVATGSVGGEAISVGGGTRAPAPLEPPVTRELRGVAAARDSAYDPVVNGPMTVESPVASTPMQAVGMPVASGVGTPVASSAVKSPILKRLINRSAIHAASSSVSNCTSISQSLQAHKPQAVQRFGSGHTVSSVSTGNFSRGVAGDGSSAGTTVTGASPSAVAHIGECPARCMSIELTPAEIVGANPGPVIFNYTLPPIEPSAVENRVESGRPVLSGPNITAKGVTSSSASVPGISLPIAQGIEDGQAPGSGSRSGGPSNANAGALGLKTVKDSGPGSIRPQGSSSLEAGAAGPAGTGGGRLRGTGPGPSSAVPHHPDTGSGGPNSSGLDSEELEDSSSLGTGRPSTGSISPGPGGSGRHSPGSGVPNGAESGSYGIGGPGFGAGSWEFGSSGTSITGPGAGPQVPTAESPVLFQGCAVSKYIPGAIIPILAWVIAFGMM